MKARLFFLILPVFFFFQIKAQFISPNNGQTYELPDLVLASSGVITFDTGFYAVHNDITISSNDTFLIDSTTKILMAPGVLITSLGHLNLNQTKGQLFIDFLPLVLGQNYQGLRIENDNNSVLRNVFFFDAGGIRLLNADIVIENCAFNNFDQSHSTGVINLFQSSPQVSNCLFLNNLGPAFNSGANIFSAPKIIDCRLEFNNSSNSNSPQINLGPSGPGDTIIIKGNEIIGDRNNTMVGGISTSNLLGTGVQNVVIDSNSIIDNRYGITCTGNNINAIITRNTILDNNSQNSPNLGGSGINFNGGNTNIALVGNNKIAGNLWGITIQGDAQPNIGDTTVLNTGYNCFSNNENSSTTYALYNNTPNPIKAQLNDWDAINPEDVITHNVDIGSLGLVDFAMAQMGLENFDLLIDYQIINDTIYFSNQVSGTINNINWQFPMFVNYENQLNPLHPISSFPASNPFEVGLETRGECSVKDTTFNIDLTCGFSINYPVFNLNVDSNALSVDYSTLVSMDSANSSLNYFWDFGDGNSSTDSAGIHNYDSGGSYLLSLTVVNQCNDTLMFSDSINLPLTISLNDLNIETFKIYPNPAQDIVQVKGHEFTKFEIVNMQGKAMLSGEIDTEKGIINLSKLKSGVYFLKLLNSKKQQSTFRILKM